MSNDDFDNNKKKYFENYRRTLNLCTHISLFFHVMKIVRTM